MKNKVILVGLTGRPSMLNLFSKLKNDQTEVVIRRLVKKKPFCFRVYKEKDQGVFKREPLNRSFADSIVIRWGNQITINTDPDTVIYNSALAVSKAINKKVSRHVFHKAGVRCPKAVTPENIENNQYPVIARYHYHSQGKNFVVLKDYNSFKDHYDRNQQDFYYSEFIDKTEEYRVHCGHGKILSMMSKPAPTEKDVIAWNHTVVEGKFSVIAWGEMNPDVCRQALGAVKSLGLDMGAVDVVVKDGLAYVLEVNTSPTINSSPYSTGKYALYFDWLFEKEERQEHFDYEKYKKVTSYAWKPSDFEREPVVGNE